MRIDIISVVPELLKSPFEHSILKRAIQKGLLEINIHNLRDFTPYKHGQVDDYPFGGEAGMVIMPEPLAIAIETLQKTVNYDEIIYTSPDAPTWNQKSANLLSLKQNLLIICGHYKGIDQRIRDNFITMEISIGDYVLSGGELAAAVIVDSVARLLPGVLNDISSALSDSFQDNLLAPPIYTRPANFRGWSIPNVLTSGNHQKIEDWKLQESLKITQAKRPDLLKNNL